MEEIKLLNEDLQDENTTLKEAVDDLLEENERLRKELKEKESKEGGEIIED